MKKLYAVIAVLALTLTIGVTAMAQGKAGSKLGRKAACSSCDKPAAAPEQLRKFKLETIDLRQEMMNKRFDLQRENLKDAPDAARVAAIKADIEAVRTRIDAARDAAKLPPSIAGGCMDCPLMEGDCASCMKAGRCGPNGCNVEMNCSATTMNCSNCNMKDGCGCMNCNKKGGCNNCPDAANCNCAKKKK